MVIVRLCTRLGQFVGYYGQIFQRELYAWQSNTDKEHDTDPGQTDATGLW